MKKNNNQEGDKKREILMDAGKLRRVAVVGLVDYTVLPSALPIYNSPHRRIPESVRLISHRH